MMYVILNPANHENHVILSKGHPSPIGDQTEGGHLFGVTDQKNVAYDYRMVPRLALNCFEAPLFYELVRCRFYQRNFTLLGKDKKQFLIC